MPEPPLSDEITAGQLDADARRDLRGLQKDLADKVARHLVAAGMLVDAEPEQALAHARFARQRASRIAVVREAAGIVAYHAGEWAEALGELRAARRMGGGPGHLAVMADIERALGRPERALELTRGPETRELGRAETIELAIVAAGARRDLGELDVAVVGLQIPELDQARRDPWSARLFYAYADNLLAAGREAEALQWFVHTADVDDDGTTDAAHRIAELTGEPLPDEDVEFGIEDIEPQSLDARATAEDASDGLAPDASAPAEESEVDGSDVRLGAPEATPAEPDRDGDDGAPAEPPPAGESTAAVTDEPLAVATEPAADITPAAETAATVSAGATEGAADPAPVDRPAIDDAEPAEAPSPQESSPQESAAGESAAVPAPADEAAATDEIGPADAATPDVATPDVAAPAADASADAPPQATTAVDESSDPEPAEEAAR